MRLRAVLPVLPAVVALLVASTGPAAAATVPSYGDLVYVHYDGSSYKLWTVTSAGTGEAALPTYADSAPAGGTTGGTRPALQHMPVFSPDGRFLAFEGRRTGGGDAGVFLQDTASGEVTVVADAPGLVEGPTGWYADAGGQHLLYVRDRSAGAMLLDAWEVPVSSIGTAGTPRPLTNFSGSLMNVTAAGSDLVFDYGTTHATTDHRICTAPLVSAAVTLPTTPACLTDGASNDRRPSVSSASGDIAFGRVASGREQIMILHGRVGQWPVSTSQNTTALSLPSFLKGAQDPQFSPNGSTIAFAGGRSTGLINSDIYTVPASGGKAKQLTTQAGTDYAPTWKKP